MLNDLLERGGAEPLPARLQPEEVTASLREVEGEVPVGLKDAELAGAVARHPAGGHVRDGAVRELDSGIGDIHVHREERHPGGPHVHDLRANQLEYQVEVVDHEIEDHGHVGAARLERGQPVDLEEPGLGQIRRRGADGAIEALHVPHLQRGAGRVGGAHQLLRALQRGGERLLDQRRHAARQHGQAHLGVRPGRHDDRHGLHPLEQRIERGVRHGVELFRHFGRARGVLVVDTGKRDARHVSQESRVMEAEGAGTNDPDAHRRALPRAHTITPRCDPSMNLRKFSTSGICGSSARALAMP